MAITISISSGVLDSAFGWSQYPIRDFIISRAQQWEENSVLDKIFQKVNSDNAIDRFASLTSPNGFQPIGENAPFPADDFQEGYDQTIMYQRWGDSFTITSDAIKFRKLNDIMVQARLFTDGWHLTRERFGAQFFGEAIKGNTSFNINQRSFKLTAADQQAYFSTAHPAKIRGAAQSNKFANEISTTAITKVETAMQNYFDDNGNMLNLSPDTIIIPNDAEMKEALFAAIGSDKEPETANNAFNYQVGRWNVIIWSYLGQYLTAGTKPWIMMDSRYNSTYGGAKWVDYGDMETKSFIDQNNNANKWNGEGYFNCGFVDWRAFSVSGLEGGTEL